MWGYWLWREEFIPAFYLSSRLVIHSSSYLMAWNGPSGAKKANYRPLCTWTEHRNSCITSTTTALKVEHFYRKLEHIQICSYQRSIAPFIIVHDKCALEPSDVPGHWLHVAREGCLWRLYCCTFGADGSIDVKFGSSTSSMKTLVTHTSNSGQRRLLTNNTEGKGWQSEGYCDVTIP